MTHNASLIKFDKLLDANDGTCGKLVDYFKTRSSTGGVAFDVVLSPKFGATQPLHGCHCGLDPQSMAPEVTGSRIEPGMTTGGLSSYQNSNNLLLMSPSGL